MFIGNKIRSIETTKHEDKRKVCVWWNSEQWCHGRAVGSMEGTLCSHGDLSLQFPSCRGLLACFKFHSPGIIFWSLLFINTGILAMMSHTLFKILQRLLGQKPLCLPQSWESVRLVRCKRGPVKRLQLIRTLSSLKCLALREHFSCPTLPTLPAGGVKQLCNLRGPWWPESAVLIFSVQVPAVPACFSGSSQHFFTHLGCQPCYRASEGGKTSFLPQFPACFPSKQHQEHTSCVTCKHPSSVKCLPGTCGDAEWCSLHTSALILEELLQLFCCRLTASWPCLGEDAVVWLRQLFYPCWTYRGLWL